MPRSRSIVVALALAGAVVAAYLVLVQTDVVAHAWDPVFGRGSDRVLRSSVSRSLPFPDAALGLVAYLLEAALALTGRGNRWQRRPVLPLLYDATALGLGAAAVLLVLLQATVVGHWCLLCLCSAALSLAIVAVGRLREGRAAVRRVRVARGSGHSWRAALTDLGPA
ncbi:vitamin K epoxide reductase family protein [Nocardioides pocheonensis]|uniref:vitamin K epoxide reductase family protein n=1 Tax=Nocardioides pocheonensis TaxID=661485 RepID=UPI0016186CAE|nr:vitamin K epoxide reductase family protein [Nocardioides pocheonensis]